MSANIPVLPVAGGALARALLALVALVTYWLKQLARARRHRREAQRAGRARPPHAGRYRHHPRRSERRLSGPFWEDPTALLRERAHRTAPVPRHARATRAWRGERLPPSADQPPGAPGDLVRDPEKLVLGLIGDGHRFSEKITHKRNNPNGRALPSAARSEPRDHPLSRPDLSARRPLRRALSFRRIAMTTSAEKKRGRSRPLHPEYIRSVRIRVSCSFPARRN